MGVISCTCRLVNSRFSDIRLLRFDNFLLLGMLEPALILVDGRVLFGVTSDFTVRSMGPDVGDNAPNLFGVVLCVGV